MNQDDLQKKKSEGESRERYLAFSLCQKQYAIPLLEVREVIGMSDPTPVPYSPDYYKGIINLRGQVISVIDLRTKLKMPKADSQHETSIIILDVESLNLGVVVDSVDNVLAFGAEDIGPVPETEKTSREPYWKGVAKKDKSLLLLVDIKSTLNTEELRAVGGPTQRVA